MSIISNFRHTLQNILTSFVHFSGHKLQTPKGCSLISSKVLCVNTFRCLFPVKTIYIPIVNFANKLANIKLLLYLTYSQVLAGWLILYLKSNQPDMLVKLQILYHVKQQPRPLASQLTLGLLVFCALQLLMFLASQQTFG